MLPELQEVDRIEKFIFKSAKNLIRMNITDIPGEIPKFLETIGRTLNIDNIRVYLFSREGNCFINSNEWKIDQTKGLSSRWNTIPMQECAMENPHLEKKGYYYLSKSNQGPEKMNLLKNRLEQESIQCIIFVPLYICFELIGFITLGCCRQRRQPEKKYIRIFQLIAEVMSNTVHRMECGKKLQDERNLLKLTLHSIGDAVITVDTNLKITQFNQAAEEITGISCEKAIARYLSDILHFKNSNRVQRVLNKEQILKGKIKADCDNLEIIDKQGCTKVISMNIQPIQMDQEHILGAVLIIKDITERYKKEKKIEFLSYHDKLTGLYNRAYIEEMFIQIDRSDNLPISIVLGDLNGLKVVNDAFGHAQGDRLLKQAAKVLKKACSKEDIIGRYGGDEFIIIMPRTTTNTAYTKMNNIKKYCMAEHMEPIQLSIATGMDTKKHMKQSLQMVLKHAEDWMYSKKLSESKNAKSAIISSLTKSLHEKTHETQEHSERIQRYSKLLGKQFGFNENELNDLKVLAVLHDIGKIATPDEILNKKSVLSQNEWKIMKMHSESGYRIAAATPELAGIAEYILHHHEHWNGGGYPQGLRKKEIPLPCRILAVLDAYDAMTNYRPYVVTKTRDEAIEELLKYSNLQFDPEVVEKFVSILRNEEKLTEKHA